MTKATTFTTALALLLAPAALVIGPPAGAAPATGHQQGHRTAHERTLDYWTPARRGEALPREVSPRQTRAGAADSRAEVMGATWTDPSAQVARTTGKVFFTLGGTNYQCSGSAVEGGGVNLVLTAGHCVWDDTDGFASRWVFYPGYDGGPHPDYGAWTAASLYTTADWSADGIAFPDDAGLAVVTDASSGTLATTLGTLPTMATESGQDLTGTHSAFGYPVAAPYGGGDLAYCAGTVQAGSGRDAGTLSMVCDMTNGSSGGPWFDTEDGTGQIVSVNSYGYDGIQRMYGPTFDGQETSMYSAASDGQCAGTAEVCTTVAATP